MNWIGSGFITIMNYGAIAEAVEENFSILTEAGLNLTTESGNDLLVEGAVT